ncbi:hypothetical protein [Pediococcus ethanolidurans]|uniref:Integral membrane protein n=2 Tax=Pediococcus ethanolidurans TaxID=319653 RepID=A0A1H9TIE1_9LACO|nr:hypothetical protein [Pediococcus ethanolidurans]MBU7555674.1 hypothetical protein [Pediococcus ethanolidurans]MBU7564573.1 hypothetical protein [Pediococcus ethanolidurans]MCV3316348.1 hypothetical protein [Pediococcus ethanolidurans]MCV3556042.1 hypothetical protein [Pediococcus ethanolidurans]MDV7719947.1 hypothetical protein [Pediococcus ethanolidurans]
MIKFKYKLSWFMLVNIFVEVLTVLFLGKSMQTQIPTLINFWGRPVYSINVVAGDQINSLIAILVVFFLAQVLIGLVSLHLCRKIVNDFEFRIPAFLDFLNIKLFNLSLADGVVIWLAIQSWTFVLIAFELLNAASLLAVASNFAFILFIVGTVAVNVGMHRKLS